MVAADAGAMQIQLGKGRGLRCTEAGVQSNDKLFAKIGRPIVY